MSGFGMKKREGPNAIVGWRVPRLVDGVHRGAPRHQELHHLVVAERRGTMERRVAVGIHGLDVGADLREEVHRCHPGVGGVLTEVATPADTGGDHQRRGPVKGRQVGVGAGRQQEPHRLDVACLGRTPERGGTGRVDPESVMRRRTEPQAARDPRGRVGPGVEQRRQQPHAVDLLLVGPRIGRPGDRREPHVDGGVERC